MKRTFFLVVGCFFAAIGIIGIFLPVIPTTSPLLMAVWCFAKSSRRLHDWLVNHRILGKYVHDLWIRGGLTKKSKIKAIIGMSLCMLISALFLSWMMRLILLGAWILGTVYILTRKTLLPLDVSVKLSEKKENLVTKSS